MQRSTKQTLKKDAQAVADLWEKAAKLASQKRLGEAQARKVLSDIYESVNHEPLPTKTAKEFLAGWAENRKADLGPRTYQAYKQVARDFLTSLGDRTEVDVAQITKNDVAKYRNAVLARTSVATANKALKYLRVALGVAHKDGLTQDNPAAKLDTLRRNANRGTERRAFTLEELQALLKHAKGEWRGLLLFGLYTGQRLKDLASLTWQNVDVVQNQLRLVTGKTGRQIIVPLAAPVLAYIEGLPSTDDPAAPLFPESYKIAVKKTSDSRLSQQFYDLLVDAGMMKERTHLDTGKGRGQRREMNEISFHSLRHSATSLLKNAGVSETVTMDIIGHDSKAMSQHYTHVDEAAKRAAIAKLPDITKVKAVAKPGSGAKPKKNQAG